MGQQWPRFYKLLRRTGDNFVPQFFQQVSVFCCEIQVVEGEGVIGYVVVEVFSAFNNDGNGVDGVVVFVAVPGCSQGGGIRNKCIDCGFLHAGVTNNGVVKVCECLYFLN